MLFPEPDQLSWNLELMAFWKEANLEEATFSRSEDEDLKNNVTHRY